MSRIIRLGIAISLVLIMMSFSYEALAKEKKSFSFALGGGFHIAPNIDDFSVKESVLPGWKMYTIEGWNLLQLSASTTYWFTEDLGINGSYNFGFGNDLDMQVMSGAFLYKLPIKEELIPYLRLGFCKAQFNWDELPGSFEDTTSLEVGGGFEGKVENFTLRFELIYRGLEFDYNKPSNVTGSSEVNAKGIAISTNIVF